MNLIIEIFFIIYIISLIICLICYLPRMNGWFASFKKQPRLYNEKKNKIALLIPARNESKVIGELLTNIAKQTYETNYFDVHIIVKDSNDPTIKMCKQFNKDNHNAYCHVISTQTCKGDAIDGCLKEILYHSNLKYDAYLIIDADCMLNNDFLEQMNNAMASGAQIIQAKKLVKNYLNSNPKANSLVSSANGLIWTMIDDLGNRYKSDQKITNMTIGTGILLTSDIIIKNDGWPYRQTLTEDIELMYDCVIKDFSTFYYSYAIMYVEESPSLSVTNKRRTRWLQGVVDSYRIYKKRLKALPNDERINRNIYFTTALNVVFWYIGIIVFYTLANLAFGVTLFIFKNPLWHKALLLGIFSFVILYLSFLVLTIACMIVERKNIKLSFFKKILLMLYHPIFYMGYIPIIFKALVSGKSKGWEVIERVTFESEDEEEHYEHI